MDIDVVNKELFLCNLNDIFSQFKKCQNYFKLSVKIIHSCNPWQQPNHLINYLIAQAHYSKSYKFDILLISNWLIRYLNSLKKFQLNFIYFQFQFHCFIEFHSFYSPLQYWKTNHEILFYYGLSFLQNSKNEFCK